MILSRDNLQTVLEEILGSRNVYFQPPSSISMKYPAIVYDLAMVRNVHSNNETYLQHKAYKVTVIDKDPESTVADEISKLPLCSYETSYTKDNLNHFVYSIFIK